MDEELRKMMLEFTDFLNEPPGYEDKMMVREYRHKAYAKWEPLCHAINKRLVSEQNDIRKTSC